MPSSQFVQILLCVVCWIILIPCILLPLFACVILFLFRKCLDLYVTKIHQDWRPIFPPDSVFASAVEKIHSGSKCVGNVCSIVQVNEDICIEELRQKCISRFSQITSNGIDWSHSDEQQLGLRLSRLSMAPKKIFGYYFWVPVKVDSTKHIWKFNAVKDGPKFDEFLLDWLDMGFESRSPWEILLARPTSGQYGGRTVICHKSNHVLGDGLALICLVDTFFGPETSECEVPKIHIIKNTYCQAIYQVLTLPTVLYQFYTLKKMRNLSEYLKEQRQTPILQKKLVHSSVSISLTSVKFIAHSLEIPVRVILACSLMSAIRKTVLQIGFSVPEHMSCLVPLPWVYNQRPTDDIICNHATTILFRYPMRQEDPLERLRIAYESYLLNLKNGMHRLSYFLAPTLNYILPAPLLKSELLSQMPVSVCSVDLLSFKTSDMFLNRYRELPSQVLLIAIPPQGNSSAFDCATVFASNRITDLVTVSMLTDNGILADCIDCNQLCETFKEEIEEILVSAQQHKPIITEPV